VQRDVDVDLAGGRVVAAHGVLAAHRERAGPAQHRPVLLGQPQLTVLVREDQLDVLARRVALETRRAVPAEGEPQQRGAQHPRADDLDLPDPDRVRHLRALRSGLDLGDPRQVALAVHRGPPPGHTSPRPFAHCIPTYHDLEGRVP
jgi:hypothetical protein